jgi:hypothetical protein
MTVSEAVHILRILKLKNLKKIYESIVGYLRNIECLELW